MENIWSDNKYINASVNILLFLLGINFLHYGQIVLPIICLILFIDNKYKFYVNNIKTFIVLCLFAISFFVFTYKQGLYCVVGFFLPMAYYIGSNIKEINESNVTYIIYIISLGMAVHVALNFCIEIKINGMHLFSSSSHYDIWTNGKISSTATVMNFVPIFGFLYYLFKYEKNKLYKILFCILTIVLLVYNFGLGQRTVYLMLIVGVLSAFILDILIFKKKKINKNVFLVFIAVVALLVIALFIMLSNEKIVEQLWKVRIFAKFLYYGASSNRIDIFIDSIKLMPKYLWGGNKISGALGIMPHDLLLDIYDWGGIIPFVLKIMHSIMFAIVLFRIFKNKNISQTFKVLVIPIFICIVIQMVLEPVMSGFSVFLIIVVLFESLVEKLDIYEQ